MDRSCDELEAGSKLLAQGAAGTLALMAYPTRLLTDGESIAAEFRPHWRLLVIPVGWLVLGVAVIISIYALDLASGNVASVLVLLVVIAIVPLVAAPLVNWWFTAYVLTTERLITRSGVIARSGIEIPLENINNVLFNQTIIERILRAGDLLIESAGESGQSRFENIPRPDAFQSQLYRVREERTKALAREERGVVVADPTEKLERLARLYRDGAITDTEFEEAKRDLLDEI